MSNNYIVKTYNELNTTYLEDLFSDLNFINSEHKEIFYQVAKKILYVSPYVHNQIRNNPKIFENIVNNGFLFEKLFSKRYLYDINNLFVSVHTDNELYRVLRNYRNQEMIRIAWRDIAGWANIDETFLDLTSLAEAFISETMEYLFLKACNSRGTPINRSGYIQRLVVLGMGKLGAWELNFSSDIDLIFFYEDDGYLDDKQCTTYYEFYTRLIQSFIKCLDTVTDNGFVFRVDTRLRPFGESGPLVMNFDGLEMYYQGQAREWERYAMVKARVVAGDFVAGEKLQNILNPFIYRRYLDYRAFGELRQLKKKISQELKRKDRRDNIKLGIGGIREIEFVGQVFQLIHGGQDKILRERRIIEVLSIIGKIGYLPQDIIIKLQYSYRFLRLVENRLQQYSDKQTHDLPTNELQCKSLAYAFGFDDWHEFLEKINYVRKIVHEIFSQVIESPQTEVDEDVIIDWSDSDEITITAQLHEIGYSNLETILPLLTEFLKSFSIRQITARGSVELNRLMPLILRAIVKCENPSETLRRILKLLEAIAGRNVYFTLLAENPLALSQLVKLSSASSWIVNYIAKYPLLLDELLDPRRLYSPLNRQSLFEELDSCLIQIENDDIEELFTSLRQFKQSHVLRIAAADIVVVIPIMVVSDYLTWLAEALISCVMQQAWKFTVQRHGTPPDASSGEIKGFAVIAYGKLGGLELSYASDLDLVFLYGGVDDSTLTVGDNPIPCGHFYAKVVKKMVSILTTQTFAGTLYEIDLRLRPSGNSGLLVSSVEAYEKYQKENAWTWEQQALVRARFIAGDFKIAEIFNDIRSRILCMSRDEMLLRQDIRQMREKMRENLEIKSLGYFDLKQARGGIADIEFIVQFGVLIGASKHPVLTQCTDVVRLLANLRDISFLSQEQADLLREAYCLFREQTHRAALLEQPATVPEKDFAAIRTRVQDVWRDKIECT